jgi:hypothetical protein
VTGVTYTVVRVLGWSSYAPARPPPPKDEHMADDDDIMETEDADDF